MAFPAHEFRVNRQERIDHGELIRWTKGFGAPNTEGRDVAAMFRESLKTHVSIGFSPPSRDYEHVDVEPPQDVPAELTAIINDTTGTLIASSYVNPRTRIAVIFGTGCNAAYMERVGDIHKIKNLGIDDEAQMAINCEWVCTYMDTPSDDPDYCSKGAFDSFEHEHLPRTKYDQIIDESSNKPGEQAFEVRPRHIAICILSPVRKRN